MVPVIPHGTPFRWPENISGARFAAHIHSGLAVGCRVALLGLPDDLGVRLNHGRPGAAHGPRAFREALTRYGAALPASWEYARVFDAGDVIPAHGHDEAAITETHRRVTLAVRAICELGLIPVGVGGGHDLTFPFVRGVIEHHRAASPAQRFEGVYADAHLDVRDAVGSGMPFRRLIEDCGVACLDVVGLDPFANAREHCEWFAAREGRVHAAGEAFPPVRAAGSLRFVSFDLDAVDASAAPGVSAMNPDGMSSRQAHDLALAAGRCPSVACFDIMELSPPHDEQGRTARLAAHLFLAFLRGLAARPAVSPPLNLSKLM